MKTKALPDIDNIDEYFYAANVPNPEPTPCPTGQYRNSANVCVDKICSTGEILDRTSGVCVLPPCSTGQIRDKEGVCVYPPPSCPIGQILNSLGACVYPECPTG